MIDLTGDISTFLNVAAIVAAGAYVAGQWREKLKLKDIKTWQADHEQRHKEI